MGIFRALWWVLVTGRDRDLGPPLDVVRLPAWIRWTGQLGLAAVWAVSGFTAWLVPVGGNNLFAGLLVLLEVSAPLLGRYRPLTALRLALFATLVALLIVRPIPEPVFLVHAWPLDMYLLPFVPVVVSAAARAQGGNVVGIVLAPMLLLSAGSVWVGERFGLSVMTGPLIVTVFAAVLGYVLGDSQRVHQESVEEREKRTILQERNRIARELHDVIGHHLSMIAVRTDSAPYRLQGLDDTAKQEFAELGTAARQALDEARRLISVLREDNAEVEHVPQPTIEDIPALVRQAEASGAVVRLTSDPGQVSALAGLAAYRIVQESLSNALRHSPGSFVDIRMVFSGKDLELSVENGANEHQPAPGEGSGLAGIRERVSLVGGECEIGPRVDGGFRVWARLPG